MAMSPMSVRVLVVDIEPSCVPLIISMLQLYNYQVVIVRNPSEAMATLRMSLGRCYFDLVLSGIHMPMVNAYEFRKTVYLEFGIPVVLMSSEHKRSILFRGVSPNGIPFFVDSPPSAEDLKNIKHYIIQMKKATGSLNCMKRKFYGEDLEAIEEMIPGKKPRIMWTSDLHNRFLDAINSLGFRRAVPKKIVEYMNVPGLTRENVASHLQKYREYIRRFCKVDEFPMRPSFYHEGLISSLNYNPFALHSVNRLLEGAYSRDFRKMTLGSSLNSYTNNNISSQHMSSSSTPFQGQNILSNRLPNNDTINRLNPSLGTFNYVGESSNSTNFGAVVNNVGKGTSNLTNFGGFNYNGEGSNNSSNFGRLGYVGESSKSKSFGTINNVEKSSNSTNFGEGFNYNGESLNSNANACNFGMSMQNNLGMQIMSSQMGGVANYGEKLIGNNNDEMINNENLGNLKVGNETYELDFDDDALDKFVNCNTSEEETLINNGSLLEYMRTLEKDAAPMPVKMISAEVPVENTANDIHILQNDHPKQKMLYSETSSGSNIFQDWGANYVGDFSQEEISEGIDGVLSSFGGNSESNNRLP